LGHAIENNYQLLHGHAISIGMIAACILSEKLNHFQSAEKERVISLFKKYHLPTQLQIDHEKIWEILKMDKKRAGNEMNFVLLNKIGEAVVYPIPISQLKELINQSL
jgi:3-dehydroquinate synthase